MKYLEKSSLEQIEKERSEQLYDKPVRGGDALEKALSKISFDGMDPDDLIFNEQNRSEQHSFEINEDKIRFLFDDFINDRKKEIEKRSTLRNEQLSNSFSQKSNSSDYEQDISLGGPKR